ncbi:MAG: glycogen synthase [Anaerolineales bacterium]
MQILFVASEMAPYVKTGGLGDVIGSLPKALRARGLDVRVVIPHYSMIPSDDYRYNYSVPRRSGDGDVSVHYIEADGVPVYLLRSWPYFVDDGKIYTVWDWDTPRFIYFSQMVMSFIWELVQREGWWPDVLHVHDWHTGLVPFLLHEARFNPGWQDVASVMTIHNMGFQGPYAGGWLWEEGIPNRDHPALPYQDRKDNLLAIGIAYAEKVTTVSPRHAIELHYPRFGEGLEGVIWARNQDFVGILNGLDVVRHNPATDPHLTRKYTLETFHEGRAANKAALQAAHGLPTEPRVPLIGVVSRVTPQKGFDFALPALHRLLTEQDVQFIGVGAGELESEFGWLGLAHPAKARTHLGYNPALAQQIYAAADLILVPSRYEPCGLAQMFAMQYGALPLVRETGGLADTVTNFDNLDGDEGTGFKFLFEQPDAVYNTLLWALDTYHSKPEAWARMQARAMGHDWSWNQSAEQYIALYADAVHKKRAWRETL